MIATILPGSADFHAVGYNEHKVSKGLARLIEMRNFGTIGLAGKPTTEELTGYLKKYSSANSRIRKPQFHVAVSCKGREMTESELLDFAHRYLKDSRGSSTPTMTPATPTCTSSPRASHPTAGRLPTATSAGVPKKR